MSIAIVLRFTFRKGLISKKVLKHKITLQIVVEISNKIKSLNLKHIKALLHFVQLQLH